MQYSWLLLNDNTYITEIVDCSKIAVNEWHTKKIHIELYYENQCIAGTSSLYEIHDYSLEVINDYSSISFL